MLNLHPFAQNVIVIVWDFDKTLIDGYMQDPVFKKYGIDGSSFWKEVNSLEELYGKRGIRVNKDTMYLNHFLTCVKQGIFPGLNNKLLFDSGAELKFFRGVPEIFEKISSLITEDGRYKVFNITIEHYIVSTGLAQMIKGSVVAPYVKGIWGCEFIETPFNSSLSAKKEYEVVVSEKEIAVEIAQVGYALDNTSKTRAIFEINKGVNLHKDIDVNSKVSIEARRVPFENMIYIADGPSDVPVFSIIKQNGGKALAVYPRGNIKAFQQVDRLLDDDRIDMYGEADYSEGTTTYMWLLEHTNQIAQKIYDKKQDQIRMSVSKPPVHITD